MEHPFFIFFLICGKLSCFAAGSFGPNKLASTFVQSIGTLCMKKLFTHSAYYAAYIAGFGSSFFLRHPFPLSDQRYP